LPGQLFHNIISHGIAKLVEFLGDDLAEVVAIAHQSSHLRTLGAQQVQDELRVMVRDANGTTAFFCFSTQVKGLNLLRVYGPGGSLVADITAGSLIRATSQPYKSYLTYFVPPLKNAREHFRNARMNVLNFLRRRLYQDFGMKELMERFYTSIRSNTPPPIPYREILLTSRIMDEIFAQIATDKTAKPVANIDRRVTAPQELPLTSVA
jgi:predicted dehydrogenase